jgi:hypothetical protein
LAISAALRTDADRLIGKADVQRIAIGLAVNGDRADAQFFTRAYDSQGNLPAVCNQYLLKHSG